MSSQSNKSRESRRDARDRLAAQREAQKSADARRERFFRIGIIAVVLLLVAGITALIAWNNRIASDFPTPPSAQEDGGLVFGSGDAQMALFEDFQCPACAQFEAASGDTVRELTEANDTTTTYYIMSFLDANLGNDASARSANASACADVAGKFVDFHKTVYANQPEVEGTGWTDDELKSFGAQAGIEGDAKTEFDSCVDDQTYSEWVRLVTKTARDLGVTSTPTVQVNGEDIPREQYTPEGLREAVGAE
jgi:protein-disulfide isomerase